ncbi:MAG TPA: hypothetical protein DF383_04570 [Deltaproteobacteria bacterium]|nr:hypothetical protein [Deltaproteobacteria bacterium]
MKKSLTFVILILIVSSRVQAGPDKLPSFILPDPQGGMHSSAQLVANGLVVIITSPILKDKSAQEGWSRDLVASRGSHPASIILIEDMTASAFQGIAASHMKKDWEPGTLPILLEDKTGKVHAAFDVGKNQTKVFVYDKVGSLIYSTISAPSMAGAKTVWSKLSK